MSRFIKLTTTSYMIVHGYDEQNREITETVEQPEPTVKLVAVERIQSISEKYVLVTASHGRLLYWEYREGFTELARQLAAHGLLIE